MRFFETVMGRTFFEGQIPKLIKALERIASSLEEKNTKVDIITQIPDHYLDDLFYGKIKFGVRILEDYNPEKESKSTKLESQVNELLDEDGQKAFEEFTNLLMDDCMAENRRMFQNGFCLAVNLITAGRCAIHNNREEDDK